MVEISLSGSGEGPGSATAPGYSTAGFFMPPLTIIMSFLLGQRERSLDPIPDRDRSRDRSALAAARGSSRAGRRRRGPHRVRSRHSPLPPPATSDHREVT